MKVLSHLSGDKESDFPYLQTGGESDFHHLQTGDESSLLINFRVNMPLFLKNKVQVGKDQEKRQSEKDSHSKNRGGKKPN